MRAEAGEVSIDIHGGCVVVSVERKKNSKNTGIDLGPRIFARNQERQERRDESQERGNQEHDLRARDLARVMDLGWNLARVLELEEGSERCLDVSARRAVGSSRGGVRSRIRRGEQSGRARGARGCRGERS